MYIVYELYSSLPERRMLQSKKLSNSPKTTDFRHTLYVRVCSCNFTCTCIIYGGILEQSCCSITRKLLWNFLFSWEGKRAHSKHLAVTLIYWLVEH